MLANIVIAVAMINAILQAFANTPTDQQTSAWEILGRLSDPAIEDDDQMLIDAVTDAVRLFEHDVSVQLVGVDALRTFIDRHIDHTPAPVDTLI